MAVASPHTYGAECRLAPITYPWSSDQSDEAPPAKAQFFYSSPIPIDDPVSPAILTGTSDSKATRRPLRPFSEADNNALERSWLSIASDIDRRNHVCAVQNREPSPELSRINSEKLSELVQDLVQNHKNKHGVRDPITNDDGLSAAVCCPDLPGDVQAGLLTVFCPASQKKEYKDKLIREVLAQLRPLSDPRSRSASVGIEPGSLPSTLEHFRLRGKTATTGVSDSGSSSPVGPRTSSPAGMAIPVRRPLVDDGISRQPFVRVGMAPTPKLGTSLDSSTPQAPLQAHTETSGVDDKPEEDRWRPHVASSTKSETKMGSAEVPVGISKLHMVSLPQLLMKPIYWSPVNDVAVVLRATWFYRDTMVPVDPIVANQLEAGYRELRPFSETWADELRCAVEVGPLGEEKVSHRLWPQSEKEGAAISTDPICAARCSRGEASAEGSLGVDHHKVSATPFRPFSNYHVIYKNDTDAFLLKPSLRPSAYYGRSPVTKIMKGMTIGIPLTRGFDWEAWNRLQRKGNEKSNANSIRGIQPIGCPACTWESEKGQVTDLVLVVHGIGQKFAERVESFHFTHAITAFRREVNIELGSPVVQSVLRRGQNGIMVLPVNWRHALSFEDGGPMKEEDKTKCMPEVFSLKDIEPNSIPAVRSIISDVMFDIPFYMSHHKQKMIEALVCEANRVYRLWCRNNPGFAENGRVHLIGHSLGSAMAVDILSRQPTTVPPLDTTINYRPNTEHFEFDTKNLFLLGSPAGFFLLLERGALMPRHGRIKPGIDPSDAYAKDVVAKAGMYGCIAVDNVYNILAKEDPIAYLLNGTIDPAYATSLKAAYVPSAATSFFKSVGDAVRGIVPGMTPSKDLPVPLLKPRVIRLPSQLEMEVHDFTREEIAEKKAYLLNDNGQIDYYLRSGGGPLEIQYLNMLSAHSCYWIHQDLIRMLCIEIGREPGRENTLPSLRAVKTATTRFAAGSDRRA